MKQAPLFDTEGIFLHTENYILRRISPNEKAFYEAIARQDTPDFLPAAETVSFLAWEELLSEEHLTCSILKKGSMAFCGFCQLQWIFTETPELGIILLPEYQKTRIATEILPPFLAQAKKQLHNKYFYSKIKKNNLPSQKLAEKIGGVFIAVHSLLPKGLPKDLSAFAEAQFPELSYLVYHFMEEDTP